ncbi:tripartite tricarboxylate transporter TctB family protein [Alphaproteobacteria bacterium GH1-50]|uniref:Tripartite tricarboxylate transporter TctB family protein n=1 Tax=Kangsaoukella pontilimi TaxID=2691042 RepID=A0A7C9IHT7_9RHOB|nr:tripartite tricarboxylate transporter TctB family protein [Kangsaoukella pontilimi]MXQ09224.1 tripartite tricarboxylate transporter TctB family protein [Kangsaoukella pontilimi]
MLRTDRIFGVVVILAALAYIASAFQIRTSFLSDPMGSKSFPILLGVIAILCGAIMVLKPDDEVEWPSAGAFLKIAFATVTMIGYAYSLKPLGFLLPTAVAAGILSYLIAGRALFAVLAGLGLSAGLFLVFKYALGLGLVAFPKGLF